MKTLVEINEDLRQWFSKSHPKGNWVRISTKGEILGPCAREPGEGKPKCLPLAKARAMSKDDRAKAARRKRREDPVADRAGKGGEPVMVKTESFLSFVQSLEEANELIEKSTPTNPELWSRAKALAKSKFDVYPSAYANGWAAKWYKGKGGKWTTSEEATCEMVDDSFYGLVEDSFDQLIDYISANLDQPLSLTVLARRSSYSRRALQYVFRQRMGCTATQWIRARRLDLARQRLLTSSPGDNVTSIALACGYRSMGLFSIEFQQRFHIKPSQLLRAARSSFESPAQEP